MINLEKFDYKDNSVLNFINSSYKWYNKACFFPDDFNFLESLIVLLVASSASLEFMPGNFVVTTNSKVSAFLQRLKHF